MFALQVKKKRAQIRLRRQRRLENLTGYEFNSSDGVLENGDSPFSDLNSNTSMSMSSDSSSPTTDSLSSTSQSDTNEPSDDSSVYSDLSSLSTVSRLDSSTDSDTESESAGSNLDSGTEADDELDASAPTAEAQLGQLVREFIRDSYSHRYQMARNQLPRGPSQMRHVLDILKPRRPDMFRESLRVHTPCGRQTEPKLQSAQWCSVFFAPPPFLVDAFAPGSEYNPFRMASSDVTVLTRDQVKVSAQLTVPKVSYVLYVL
ncbi:hypothetical protein BDR07DRAFT_1418197 [Suillus spraguei]|nr:hypothetical protein BDR07DRAFT_1418197 [Suillus spraguei]